MHDQQINYTKSIRDKFPNHFNHQRVLDVGSLDINGNNRYLFTDSMYLGIDIGLGKNVDLVCKGHEFKTIKKFDFIISTECFEHDMFWQETLRNLVENILAPGGMFLFTCATDGRAEHGTRRTTPIAAPLLEQHGEWFDYYQNLNEAHIRSVIDCDAIFSNYEFSIGHEFHDLYFYGIKKLG
jgi:SAM-dependent methyltransferase